MSDTIVIQDAFLGFDYYEISSRPAEVGSWIRNAEAAYTVSNYLCMASTIHAFHNAVMDVAEDMSFSLVFTTINAGEMTLLCRLNIPDPYASDESAYGLQAGYGSDGFVRYDGGVKTELKLFDLGAVAGDTVKFKVSGSTLSAYVNDVLIDTFVDTTYTEGIIGFNAALITGAAYWDDALGVTTPPVPPVTKVPHLTLMGVD